MTRAIILFFHITLLVVAAVWLANEPGTVTIVWRNWRIDPPIGLLVLAVVLIALLTAIGYRGWRFLVKAPGRVVASRRISKERRGYHALAEGMVALAGGDSPAALRQARRAAALLQNPAATHLLLAQASELEGNNQSALSHFEAMLDDPATEFAGLQGLMRYSMKARDTENAFRYARRAIGLRPSATWLLPDLFKLQVALGMWADADATIAAALKRHALPADQGRHWRAAVLTHRGYIADVEGDTTAAIGFMREAYDLEPGLVPAAVPYARLLTSVGKERRAKRVLEHSWTRNPHPAVAAAYVDLVAGTNPLERVKAAQRLLSFQPDHPCGKLLVAETSLRAQLWGEARKHLEDVVRTRPTAMAYRLLSELERAEGASEDAVNKWQAKIPSAQTDETWICGTCGEAEPAWKPVCEKCGSIASVVWRLPSRAPSDSFIAERPTLSLPARNGLIVNEP